MSTYLWQARSAKGQLLRGELQAGSEGRARELLQRSGLTPLQLQVKKESSLLQRNVWGGQVRTKELILFARQVSSMIQAGVPILSALRSVEHQTSRPVFQRVLQRLARDIENGDSLSLAMAKHPNVFSPFFLGIIRTGEASGKLAESLATLAEYSEQEYLFRRKIISALIYPGLIISTMLVVSIIVFAFVLPQLIELFADAQVTLPLPTRIVLAVTTFWINYWYVVALLVVALTFVIRSYVRTPEGRYTLSSVVLRIPVFKILFQRIYLARLTSMLHTLLSSNVPLLESLQLVEKAIGNRVYQRLMSDTVRAVRDGASISSVWQHEPQIPPLLATMVSTGEHSGQVDRALAEANRFFKRDVEEAFNFITVLFEPIVVIILGIGVAILVAAVFLPIYNLVLTF
jgi:type II secretory pathway component PulF